MRRGPWPRLVGFQLIINFCVNYHYYFSSVNIPWPECGMGDADYIHAFQKVVMPIAMEFGPELVISKCRLSCFNVAVAKPPAVYTVSAGFDAAAGDDLGECFVSPAGYAHMTHMLSGLASGRLVVALEVR